MEKIALILHGWPQNRVGNYFLVNFFKDKGYRVLTPDLFDSEFIFSPEEIFKRIKKDFDGGTLDVIVGISLGGLITPHIARKSPNSKLIFIASGPYLKAKPFFFNFVLKLLKYKFFIYIGKLILKLPDRFLAIFYKMGSPFSGSEEERKAYEEDMYTNIKFIKNIPIDEEIKIMKFATTTDNTELLKTLGNRTLIFNGEKDLMMPAERGEMVHKLLRNSKLIINDGEHFDVFTSNDLPEIDTFLT